MKKEKYGFIYIWRDWKHRRFYIGCHWGTEDDGYICSSNWMRAAYRKRKEDFKRRILRKNILSIKEMFLEEKKWLSMIKKEEMSSYSNKPRYYNLTITDGHWMTNEKIEKDVRKRKSEAVMGEKNPFYGKKHKEETKKQISESTKGEKSVWFGKKHAYETIEKLREINTGEGNPMFGKSPTKEHREKTSYALIGIKRSDETKKRMSKAKKGQIPNEETRKKMSIAAKKRHERNKILKKEMNCEF